MQKLYGPLIRRNMCQNCKEYREMNANKMVQYLVGLTYDEKLKEIHLKTIREEKETEKI